MNQPHLDPRVYTVVVPVAVVLSAGGDEEGELLDKLTAIASALRRHRGIHDDDWRLETPSNSVPVVEVDVVEYGEEDAVETGVKIVGRALHGDVDDLGIMVLSEQSRAKGVPVKMSEYRVAVQLQVEVGAEDEAAAVVAAWDHVEFPDWPVADSSELNNASLIHLGPGDEDDGEEWYAVGLSVGINVWAVSEEDAGRRAIDHISFPDEEAAASVYFGEVSAVLVYEKEEDEPVTGATAG